jgi:hypothetical protein
VTHAEREHAQSAAEALLDLLDVLDLEVVGIELVRKARQRLSIEQRHARRRGELRGDPAAAGSQLR